MPPSTLRLRSLALFAPFAAVGVVHLVALFVANEPLALFTKPFLMPTLLLGLLCSLPTRRTEIALLGSLAILFSWFGDIAMMFTGELGFLWALGFFLLAHLSYIVLIQRHLRVRTVPFVALAYLGWLIALVALLAPHVAGLLVPLVVYGIVMGAMAGLALAANVWVAVGAGLFVASDGLLAINRFMPQLDIWQIDFLIMFGYITGQGLIAVGVVVSARRLASAVSAGRRRATEVPLSV